MVRGVYGSGGALCVWTLAAAVSGCSDDAARATPQDLSVAQDVGPADAPADASRDAAGDADAAAELVAPPTVPTAAGEHQLTLGWQGTQRPTYLFIPPGYDPQTAAPLVFALHGGGEEIAGFRKRRQGFIDYAASKGAIAVLPQGVAFNGTFHWSSHGDTFAGADDVGFFVALLQWLEGGLAIDPARVYMVGFSNGGGMTQRFAAERPDLLRAAASICMAPGYVRPKSGNTLQVLCGPTCRQRCAASCVPTDEATLGVRGEIPQPRAPIPIALVRGGADLSVCHERRCGLDGFVYDDTVTSVKFWLDANGCDATAFSTETPKAGAELRKFERCSGDAVVYAFFDEALDHSWLPWLERPLLDFLLAH